MDISVVVLVYKSAYRDVLATVNSVIKQTHESFELIISDDGSNALDYDLLQKHLKSIWNGRLIILNNTNNVGTIHHCINAASVCSGKYIKLLGAGDLLHDETTLRSIVNFMSDNNLKMGFGRMFGYRSSSLGEVQFFRYLAPLFASPYLRGDLKRIRKNLVNKRDYICGASMFFERTYMIEKFKILGRYLKYVEDLCEYLVVFDNERIMMMDCVIVYYELSSGISTNPNNNTSGLMKTDLIEFWRAITQYTDVLREKKRFLNYERIEVLRKQDRMKRIALRLLYDRWYYPIKYLRLFINGKRLTNVRDNGFFSRDDFLF